MELITRGLRVRMALWPELSFSRYEDSIAAKGKTRKGTLKNCRKKTLENQTELTNTTAYVAQLEHRANYSKAETLRSPKTQSSVGKQDSSFATLEKKKTKMMFTL